MRPRSLGRLISITSTLRARLSVPVSTKRKTHPIHDPPAGNLPDRSYGSRRHPPNLWALPSGGLATCRHGDQSNSKPDSLKESSHNHEGCHRFHSEPESSQHEIAKLKSSVDPMVHESALKTRS